MKSVAVKTSQQRMEILAPQIQTHTIAVKPQLLIVEMRRQPAEVKRLGAKK